MRTFPAAFTAALAKNSGTPIWILSLTAGGVTYYLSDQGRNIPTWNGGVTLRPWVTSWGQVTESLGLGHREINVSDFSASFRIDPSAAPNMETIASADDIEASAATLYLWFAGLDPATDPPQALWSGFVDVVEIPDDATVIMTFEDGSSRLRTDLGIVVTTAVYPTADPDDVGKILPEVFGVVKNLPPIATAAGRLTSLKADITISATSAIVLDVTGLAVNDYCDIGEETIKITAINTGTLTLTITRAQSSTTASAHVAGEAVIQQVSLYKLIAARGAVTTLDRVLLRVGTDLDITDLVTRYTGQAGSIYTAIGYTGHAVLTLSVAQIKSIRTRVAAVSALTIDVDNPAHGHGYEASRSQAANNMPATAGGGGYNYAVATPTYPSISGIIEQTNSYQYGWSGGDSGSYITINGVRQTQHDGFSSGSGFLWSGTTSGATPPSVIHQRGSGYGAVVTINTATRTVVFDSSSESTAQATAVTGEINSSLDRALGGQLLVDLTASETTPKAACEKILGATVTLTGAFPAGYAVNGAILQPRPFIECLNQIAFECRAWFRYLAGIPRLIVRPDTLTSARTLSACAVDANLMRQYSRKKTAATDILNTITLRYGRDYSKDGDEAYTLTSDDSDSASVAVHGVKADDDLFRCDFITSAAMADSVRAYYLGRYAQRGWEHRFSVFLDQLPVEFADAVALAFAGNVVGEVMESRLTPGQGETIDRIELMIEGPAPDRVAPVVTAFTGPATSAPMTISGITLTATDNKAVTGYLITESATPPLATDSGWVTPAPTTYLSSSEGAKTLYAWAKDASGNVSAVYAPLAVTIDNAPPTFTTQPSVQSLAETTATLAFGTSDAESDHYLLEGSSDGGSNWSTLVADQSPGAGKTATISGLTANTAYTFRLRITALVGDLAPVLSDTVAGTTTAHAPYFSVQPTAAPTVDGAVFSFTVADSVGHNLDIDFYNGGFWSRILSAVAPGAKSYTWSGQAAGDKTGCQFRLSEAGAGSWINSSPVLTFFVGNLLVTAFDPATKDSNVTLISSDSTAGFGGFGAVRTLIGKTSGIWTCRLSIDVLTDTWLTVGIIDAAQNLENLSLSGSTSASLGFYPTGGYGCGGTGYGGGATFAQGSEILLQLDAATRKARISNDGGIVWSAWTIAISGSGAIYFAVSAANSVGKQVSLIPY